MRTFTALLIIVFSLLQYRLWFGKNSVPDYFSLQEDVAQQKLVNLKLQQRNKLLYADTDDLKLGTEAIEERARNELGMIKENETFFRVIPNKEPSGQNDTSQGLY
ncbi:cell division protein FtsB [Colwellia sp. MSW7]|uniref:Cell division protein FtsB n=1 Tax=Colwellia maritima TaxID=2912588 RepID=A0ABS9X1G9_9GAMM|nr:cell division protein FtsB [Colwellia maritima]MCI2283301.1 cell division protein FtsB [Colwellia maritima]